MASYDVTALDSPLTLDTATTPSRSCSVVKIDDTHVVIAYTGTDDDGFIRAFSINATTGEMTALGTALEFDTGNAVNIAMCMINATQMMLFWKGVDSDGFTQVFTVDTGTWAVTAESTPVEYQAVDVNHYGNPVLVDSTHVLHAWQDAASGDGFAQVFSVVAGAVVPVLTPFEFDTADANSMALAEVDDTHYLLTYGGVGNDGFAVVLAVNAITFAVTAAGSAYEFDTLQGIWNTLAQVDSTHFVNFWCGDAADGFAQVLTVNTGTWAVTEEGTALEFDTADSTNNSCIALGSGYFINFWNDAGATQGEVRVFNVDGSFAVTAVGTSVVTFDATEALGNKSCLLTSDWVVNVWSVSNVLTAQVFEVEIPVVAETTSSTIMF